MLLQQYLTLAVLKHISIRIHEYFVLPVATVLTACGIETRTRRKIILVKTYQVATVLTACGIETFVYSIHNDVFRFISVATVLTACGIETHCFWLVM